MENPEVVQGMVRLTAAGIAREMGVQTGAIEGETDMPWLLECLADPETGVVDVATSDGRLLRWTCELVDDVLIGGSPN